MNKYIDAAGMLSQDMETGMADDDGTAVLRNLLDDHAFDRKQL